MSESLLHLGGKKRNERKCHDWHGITGTEMEEDRKKAFVVRNDYAPK
jgi:hypothetical protein